MTMEKWNSRKMIVCLVAFAVASALVAFGKISGAEWAMVVGGTVGVYLGGQAYIDSKGY